MPANKKYLLKTKLARTSKVLASIIGGLAATIGILSLLGLMGLDEFVILTIWFVFPSLWVFFITLVYWVKEPKKAWGMLGALILVSGLGIIFLKTMA
ncbi:MAG: hypothetical protein AAF992_23815 [Bacteroidota bacterium]